MAEFLTKVENPVKLPDREVLTNSIHGVRKRLKVEMDPEKRRKLKVIRHELSLLRAQL
jgi:hypothetical protein